AAPASSSFLLSVSVDSIHQLLPLRCLLLICPFGNSFLAVYSSACCPLPYPPSLRASCFLPFFSCYKSSLSLSLSLSFSLSLSVCADLSVSWSFPPLTCSRQVRVHAVRHLRQELLPGRQGHLRPHLLPRLRGCRERCVSLSLSLTSSSCLLLLHLSFSLSLSLSLALLSSPFPPAACLCLLPL